MTLSSFFFVKNFIIPSQLKLRFDSDYTISRMNDAIWLILNLLNNGNCSRHRHTVIAFGLTLSPVTISDINILFLIFLSAFWANLHYHLDESCNLAKT